MLPSTHALRRLPRPSLSLIALTLALCCGWLSSTAQAQVLPTYEGHQPLSQRSQVGLAAKFAGMAGRTGFMQPVRFVVDDGTQVSLFRTAPAYAAKPVEEVRLGELAQASLMVGHTYRIKVTNIPDMPGVEIFPTVELIDHLHPPAGQKDNFPVVMHVTKEDVELAVAGNLVTRVVYLEQPQLAAPYELDRATATQNLLRSENALTEADRRGRPIAIVRIGGRLPATHGEHPSFFGSGGPIMESRPTPKAAAPQAEARTPSARQEGLR